MKAMVQRKDVRMFVNKASNIWDTVSHVHHFERMQKQQY